MYISHKVIIGIVLGVALITLPFWLNMGQNHEKREVSLDTPVIQAMEEKKCIEDTDYMRANHMKLLAQWRDAIVRRGDTIYVASDGQEYVRCMQETCFYCHSNKEQFCDACHDYVGAQLNCWECHLNM